MPAERRCTKYTDCFSCEHYRRDIYKFRLFPGGYRLPRRRCERNTICFLLKGSLWIHSDEHPDTTLRAGQFFLQPVGSYVESEVLESVECIFYLFERPRSLCESRYRRGVYLLETENLSPAVLTMNPLLEVFFEGVKRYLLDDLKCETLLEAKRTEMIHLLNSYYPLKDLSAFFAPLYRYSQTFHYFVMQNYQKAKDVESFAKLGGYTVSTFRRIFKENFGVPAYQWMLKRKCEDIHDDLAMTDLPISEICAKYGFDSLSNFSHFCSANFGQSPRAIRSLENKT